MKIFKKVILEKGFLICFLFSCLVTYIYFGKLFSNPNSIFFGTSLDATQVYFNSVFHAKYDKDFLNSLSMFYPYSESSFFTACMPLLTTVVKYAGLENYTVGIINILMLLSFPISAMFLYLIFKEYRIPILFAAISSVCIAFLSPQILRLLGHFTLSFGCVIPLTIWLILKFKNNPTYLKSVIIAVNLFFWATMHMYLYVFLVAIISSYWIFVVINFKNEKVKFKELIFHYFVQIILPFLLLQLLIFLVDTKGVRTNSPWGFFVYFSNISGIFYTSNPLYTLFYNIFNLHSDVSYEGVAFIGMAAVIFCFFIAVKIILGIIRFKVASIFNVMNDSFLSTLFYCSIFCLLFSFCIPFKYGFENLLNYMGFLKQFRALGRFTWIFYYVINICLIIYVSKMSLIVKKYGLNYILMFLVVGLLGFDGYNNIKSVEANLNNSNKQWTSEIDNLPELNWLKTIDSNDYQAILSLPHFQTGSENLISKTISEKSVKISCLISIKTGLPLISVLGSRLVLDRAYENLRVTTEPTGNLPKIFYDFKNQKDILIIAINNECNEYEKEIISYSRSLFMSDDYCIYKISLSQLKKYYENYSKHKMQFAKSNCIFKFENYFTNDTLGGIVFQDFKNNSNVIGCFDKGVLTGKCSNYTTIINSEIPNNNDSLITLSFWVKNLQHDLMGRTNFEITAKTKENEVYSILYSNFVFHYGQLDDNWAQIEYSFKIKNKTDVINATIWNPELKDVDLIIDDVLLKPTKTNIYFSTNNGIIFNNKIYYNINEN